jgi:hypothetical protein
MIVLNPQISVAAPVSLLDGGGRVCRMEMEVGKLLCGPRDRISIIRALSTLEGDQASLTYLTLQKFIIVCPLIWRKPAASGS